MARKKSCNAATTSMLLWWCLPCIWVGQASLPAGAPLQVLLPVQQITLWGDGHLFSGPLVLSWPALLQSVGLAGATHMQQPDAGSGSVGSRIHVSHRPCAKSTALAKELYFWWGMEEVAVNHVKYSGKFQQSLLSAYLRVLIFWWRHSLTTLFT